MATDTAVDATDTPTRSQTPPKSSSPPSDDRACPDVQRPAEPMKNATPPPTPSKVALFPPNLSRDSVVSIPSTYPTNESTFSVNTVTSTAPLLSSPPTKDSKRLSSSSSSAQGSSSSTASASSSSTIAPVKKDFEASFGKLYSSYGFGGDMPTLPTKVDKKKPKKKKSA